MFPVKQEIKKGTKTILHLIFPTPNQIHSDCEPGTHVCIFNSWGVTYQG